MSVWTTINFYDIDQRGWVNLNCPREILEYIICTFLEHAAYHTIKLSYS